MDDTVIASHTTVDVVVLGGGIAGLSAALSAAENGAETVLLEKQPLLGGSSALSGGLFAFAGTDEQKELGISDTSERLRQDLIGAAGGRSDVQLVDTYAADQSAVQQWMKDKGIDFDAIKIGAGQSVARSHHTRIREVLEIFRAAFLATGRGRILPEHRASRLERVDSRVNAVVAETPQGRVRFDVRGGVIIATGGFSRSPELLEIFVPSQASGLPYGGLGNTGDGLKMAWRLGAAFRGMGYVTGTYGSHPETGPEENELLCSFYMGGIIVNLDGKRFVDESLSYKVIGDVCLRQQDGMGFQVFDAQVRAKSTPGVALNDIDFLEDKGRLFIADTIEELASAAGINGPELIKTIDRYNESVHRGQADEFGRDSLCNHVGERTKIFEPPFYAYPAKTTMTSTMCGLVTSPKAEVLDVEGEIIEGLYAAGEVAGAFHGVTPMTGASLGMSTIFGRIAGREAAQRSQKKA